MKRKSMFSEAKETFDDVTNQVRFMVASDAHEALWINVEEAEQILARAFIGASQVESQELMDEISAELSVIADWKDSVECCDDEGLDCTDTDTFMRVLGRAKFTGRTLTGNYIDAPVCSGAKVDVPTGQRVRVWAFGREVERTVYHRITWRNGKGNKLLAKFVIVDGEFLELA